MGHLEKSEASQHDYAAEPEEPDSEVEELTEAELEA